MPRHGHGGWTSAKSNWLVAACVCLVVAAGGHSSAQKPPVSEAEVKATWLLNFARYVEWPADAFAGPDSPVVVGIVGKDPFGPALEKILADRVAKGRRFSLKRLAVEDDLHGCHIVFCSSSEKRRNAEVLKKVRPHPVLTVSESDEFLEQGGILQLVRKDDTIRFAVNLDAAGFARLKVSAKLVKFAVSVRGRYE